jgi:transcriptional regulator with XRE-family HTH domain
MTFTERLVFAREQMGMIQAELAKLSEVSVEDIEQYECGWVEQYLLNNLKKICLALRVSADYLLDIDIKELWGME